MRRSYAELAERIDQLASSLEQRGVGKGDRVAYLGANAPEFLETLFAVTSLGAIFVPLNTRLAAGEISHALDDSGSTLVVHSRELAHLVTGTGIARIVVDGEDAADAPSYETVLRSGGVSSRTWTAIRRSPDPCRSIFPRAWP